MSAVRPASPGKTRTCPHCKAVILDSASVCPGCQHHLRFGSDAGPKVAARTALFIEGKIVGSGHVRIAGRFKGDVQVDGNLTIDTGANLDGQVRAQTVTVGGELKGNIENAKRVELLEGGAITGDVKAGSLTVAAGSRMRGQVEFGWDEETKKSSLETKGFGTAT